MSVSEFFKHELISLTARQGFFGLDKIFIRARASFIAPRHTQVLNNKGIMAKPLFLFLFLAIFCLALAHCSVSLQSIPLGGGGYVTGVLAHPTADKLFFRTDVGGVYVFNSTTNRWTVTNEQLQPLNKFPVINKYFFRILSHIL